MQPTASSGGWQAPPSIAWGTSGSVTPSGVPRTLPASGLRVDRAPLESAADVREIVGPLVVDLGRDLENQRIAREHGGRRRCQRVGDAIRDEHLPRVVWISGFAEDGVLQDNDRICAEYDRGRELPGNVLGFRICYPPGIGPRHFTRDNTFIDIGRKNRERYGKLRQ